MAINDSVNNITNNYNNIKVETKQKLNDAFQKININLDDELLIDNKGINGFSFMIPEETKIKLEKTITQYTLENNDMVASGCSLQPLTFNLSGKVGELFIEAPLTEQKSDNVIQASLNEVGAFAPRLSAAAQQYYNKTTNIINKVENVFNTIDGAFDFLENLIKSETETQQELAFKALNSIWSSKVTFSINIEYGIFNNCTLKSVEITQGDNKYISNINLEIQQLNFVEKIIIKQATKITATQKAETKNNGTANMSILFKGNNYFNG